MALGVGASVFIILVLLAFFFFLLKLSDSFMLNRHRKKYETYDDPSKKGGEFRESFERRSGTNETRISNLEGEGAIKGSFILPTDKVESRTEENPTTRGDESKLKKSRVLRRRK